MPEPRSPVMILVEATWEDEEGNLQAAQARMENRSLSGACIRSKVPIGVDSKLKIQWRWEEFSGLTKYCRREGKDYLIGIHKDLATSRTPEEQAGDREPQPEKVSTGTPQAATRKVLSPEKRHKNRADPPADSCRVIAVASRPVRMPEAPKAAVGGMERANGGALIGRQKELGALQEKENPATQAPKTEEARNGRKSMARKWLGIGNWGEEKEVVNGDSKSSSGNSPAVKNGVAPGLPKEKPAANEAGEDAFGPHEELLALDEIYSTAGIVAPRKGYNITKVVEMLHSEHMHGLSRELKRNSVLMALDAAGVSTEAVMEDAKARLQAIDSYEGAQKKQFEAEWARRAEENAQIQKELESIKARYMDRLKRNQDGVAREKATFGKWMTLKQQEAQSILDAMELCLKPLPAEPPGGAMPVGSVSDAITKPV